MKKPLRLRRGLAAARDVELPKDRRDMVADGLLGEEEALGDVGVAKPLGDEPRPRPRARSGRRVLPRRGPRAARQALAPRSRRRRATIATAGSAPSLQSCSSARAAHLVVSAGEGKRALVGAAKLGQRLGRPLVFARELGRVGLGDSARDLLVDPGSAAPDGDSPMEGRLARASAGREAESVSGATASASPPTRRPPPVPPRPARGTEGPPRCRDLVRFVQRGAVSRSAAPSPGRERVL